MTVQSFADLLVKLANEILKIVAKRDSLNNVGEQLLAVLPHHLVKSDMRALASNIEVHEQHLLRVFSSEAQVQQINAEFIALLSPYRIEPPMKTALASTTGKDVSFHEAWSPVAGHLNMLQEFCGGIARVFPNSATVEVDFSRLGL